MAELQVVLEQIGPSASKGTARSHSVIVDRPVPKGGTDQGALGGEYLLLAAGGCFSSHLLAAIRARNLPVSDVKVLVTGKLDGSPERFTEVSLNVSATCDEDQLAKLTTIAERACQVLNTLKASAAVSVTARALAPAAK
jgi:putative redox protein